MTEGARPRVFLSSVIDGFEPFRAEAKRRISEVGGEPVLVEDLASVDESSRNVCLDGVESCDCVVVVVGPRGGWRAPSGKLVVAEEALHALKKKIPVLIFVTEQQMDRDASDLSHELSEYVHGRFRRTFTDETSLGDQIHSALENMMDDTSSSAGHEERVNQFLASKALIERSPVLRLVVTPERHDTVFDSVAFGDQAFAQRINEIGHSGSPPLLSYEVGKSPEVGRDSFRLVQPSEGGFTHSGPSVVLHLHESGTVLIDQDLEARDSRDAFAGMHPIRPADIDDRLLRGFRFIGALYEREDPHHRYARLYHNARVMNLGYRTIGDPSPAGGGVTMRMSGPEALNAFATSTALLRQDFDAPSELISRIITMLKRQQ